AVAREVDQPQLHPARLVRHLAQRRAEAVEAEVLAQEHCVELELPLEGRRDGGRVVARICETPDLIVGVADNQRDAPSLGMQQSARKRANASNEQTEEISHAGPRLVSDPPV